MRSELTDKIEAFCTENGLLPSGGTVLCCVSGGADSMCLLTILNYFTKRLDFSLQAAHFNHRLRGAESDGDEDFVRRFCGERGIPLHVGAADVLSEAQSRRRGVEETARELRYAFFERIAGTLPNAVIATAHTADDNLETVLLHLSRGTGLRGLCGIPPRRGNIVRPLLPAARAEVEAFNLAHGVPHREDASNQSDSYARNRLRHRAVPVLRTLNPRVAEAVTETSALLREDEAFLQSLADDFLASSVPENAVETKALLALPFPVASRVVRTLCGELSAAQVREVLRLAGNPSPSASLSLPGLRVRREYGRLIFGGNESARNEPARFEPFELSVGQTVEVPALGLRFSAEQCQNSGGIYKSFTTFLFKFEAVCGKLTVRPRKTGDCLCLSPRSGTKSLKKLFIEKKIPREKRELVPVLCDGNGPIAAQGLGCDIRVRPEPGGRVLKVTIEEITEL